eukprot:GFYU01007083.1.p1 GENE.GFYU01007083.1~~GFYU01007083.1.p1  ORF type:complete len:672 (-),score=162.46 GFYU01007083.1:129-2144(-)
MVHLSVSARPPSLSAAGKRTDPMMARMISQFQKQHAKPKKVKKKKVGLLSPSGGGPSAPTPGSPAAPTSPTFDEGHFRGATSTLLEDEFLNMVHSIDRGREYAISSSPRTGVSVTAKDIQAAQAEIERSEDTQNVSQQFLQSLGKYAAAALEGKGADKFSKLLEGGPDVGETESLDELVRKSQRVEKVTPSACFLSPARPSMGGRRSNIPPVGAYNPRDKLVSRRTPSTDFSEKLLTRPRSALPLSGSMSMEEAEEQNVQWDTASAHERQEVEGEEDSEHDDDDDDAPLERPQTAQERPAEEKKSARPSTADTTRSLTFQFKSKVPNSAHRKTKEGSGPDKFYTPTFPEKKVPALDWSRGAPRQAQDVVKTPGRSYTPKIDSTRPTTPKIVAFNKMAKKTVGELPEDTSSGANFARSIDETALGHLRRPRTPDFTRSYGRYDLPGPVSMQPPTMMDPQQQYIPSLLSVSPAPRAVDFAHVVPRKSQVNSQLDKEYNFEAADKYVRPKTVSNVIFGRTGHEGMHTTSLTFLEYKPNFDAVAPKGRTPVVMERQVSREARERTLSPATGRGASDVEYDPKLVEHRVKGSYPMSVQLPRSKQARPRSAPGKPLDLEYTMKDVRSHSPIPDFKKQLPRTRKTRLKQKTNDKFYDVNYSLVEAHSPVHSFSKTNRK